MCTSQSPDSERASAEWQSAVVTPQFNLSFSFMTRVSKHLIELIVSIVVSAIAVFRQQSVKLSSLLDRLFTDVFTNSINRQTQTVTPAVAGMAEE